MILKIDREVCRSLNLFSIDHQIGKTRYDKIFLCSSYVYKGMNQIATICVIT